MSRLRASLVASFLALFSAACGRARVAVGAACSPLSCRAQTFDGGCAWAEPVCCGGVGTTPACGWSQEGTELSLQDGGVDGCEPALAARCL